jgi:PhnB protein
MSFAVTTNEEERMSIKKLNPYILFNGTAEKAIRLYESALGARTENMTHYGEVPGSKVPAEHKSLVMHAVVRIGEDMVMVSDTTPDKPAAAGESVQVCLDFADVAGMTKAFHALSEGGTVTLPLHDAFWGAKFGMLTDPFGVRWMFNCTEAQHGR